MKYAVKTRHVVFRKYEVHDHLFRHSSNITATASTILEVSVLVLAMKRIYEVRR
jgi:hypothetical protein